MLLYFCILRAADMFINMLFWIKTSFNNVYYYVEYNPISALIPTSVVFFYIQSHCSVYPHYFNTHRHSGPFGTMLNFPVHCLPLLLGDENKVSLLGLGALEPLCQLITHSNKLVRRNAFMALGIMATNCESDNIRNQCRLSSVIWWLTIPPVWLAV